MVDTGTKTSRSLLKPVIAGIVLIAALVLIVAFRGQLADLISKSGSKGGSSILSWIPDHKDATVVIIGAFVVALGIDWLAHIVGRLRAWIFVVVVEAGLWILFWNSVGIPPLKDLIGLDGLARITGTAQFVSGLIILVLSGVIFWILEAKEAWSERRRSVGDS
ncbi:MAG TPA: hypothetical protein VH561_17715 [Micromonosporaceae bacterium]|jgi:hypothetical protein